MLSFLRGPSPPRTKISHLPTLVCENGRSSVTFSSGTLTNPLSTISFTLPPADPGPDPKDNSFFIPPYHFHPRQTETFRVISGTLLVKLNGKKIKVPAGDEITIPVGDWHTFSNASSEVPMTVEASFTPAENWREERFFRNLCGYLEDVNRPGASMGEGEASFIQIVGFAWEAEIRACDPGNAFFPLESEDTHR